MAKKQIIINGDASFGKSTFNKNIVNNSEKKDFGPRQSASMEGAGYDFFISYASEDRDEIARPLAEALKKRGAVVWFDDFSLSIGDNIEFVINMGLRDSRFGIVVITPNFINKEWTKKELGVLAYKETNENKVILPVWHKISKTEVMNFDAYLANKLALNTAVKTIDEIANELMIFLKKDSAL